MSDLSVQVRFAWSGSVEVEMARDGRLVVVEEQPDRPAIYIWTMHGHSGERDRVYIGESDNLRTRCRQHLREDRRGYRDHVVAGGRLTVRWATRAEVAVGGESWRPLTMMRQSARRLAENAAITAAYSDRSLYVLNWDTGPKTGDRHRTLEEDPATGQWRLGDTRIFGEP